MTDCLGGLSRALSESAGMRAAGGSPHTTHRFRPPGTRKGNSRRAATVTRKCERAGEMPDSEPEPEPEPHWPAARARRDSESHWRDSEHAHRRDS